jgi:CIC family chloride channel protein
MSTSRRGWARRRAELAALANRSRQVVVLAAVTGAVTGLVVAGFEQVVSDVALDHIMQLSPWLLAAMPLVGLLLAAVLLRVVARTPSPDTSDAYLRAFHDADEPMRAREIPGKLLAAITTLGFGGAMGLEGPSLAFGAAFGSWLQRRFARIVGPADRNLLLVAGAAAGVAAIFKAPATGAIFALEVPYQDDFARRMLLPALVSAASGYLVFAAINGTAPIFPVHGTPPFSFADLAGAALLGVVAALVARGFAWWLRAAKRSLHTVPLAVRLPIAGFGLAACFTSSYLLTDRPLGIGPGYEVIDWVAHRHRALWLLAIVLLVRMVATTATVGGGGVGGLFIPLVVCGAVLGGLAGEVAGDQTSLFLVIGVAAFLGAGYRVPLAAVMFVAETTGRPGFVVPALLAAVAAELVMGRSSVTEYQRMGGMPSQPSTEGGRNE